MMQEVPTEEGEQYTMLMKRQYMATISFFELLVKLNIKSARPHLDRMQRYNIWT